HGCFFGSYCTFNEWRQVIAVAAQGMRRSELRDVSGVEQSYVLEFLLRHSDSSGGIRTNISNSLADQLQKLAPWLSGVTTEAIVHREPGQKRTIRPAPLVRWFRRGCAPSRATKVP